MSDPVSHLIAADIAEAVVVNRHHGHHDLDELKQDFIVWTLDSLRRYDSSKGALSTWVYAQHGYWWGERHRIIEVPTEHDEVFEAEAAGVNTDHRVSPEAQRLLALVPAKGRGLVETHIAYGASLTATAELHGVTDRTVSRWAKAAKKAWQEVA